jgi:hypothetical protein
MSESANPATLFDKTWASLQGVPDVSIGQPTTIRTTSAVKELPQTYIVQTARHRELGDFAFVEFMSAEGTVRIVLPPKVTDAIARQRDALTTKTRKRVAKEQAAKRKAAGIVPGFMRQKPKVKKKGATSNE